MPRLFVASFALAAACLPACANDRPFQLGRTALADDDDEGVSMAGWAQRWGGVRSITIAPEYTFRPGTSLELEYTRSVDRRGDETGHELALDFKHVVKRADKGRWGWAINVELGRERTQGRGGANVGLFKVPLSIALGAESYLHLTSGIEGASGDRRKWLSAVAFERLLFEKAMVFTELWREGRTTSAQAGLRWWLRAEKLSVDVALQHRRGEGERSSGVIVGFNMIEF
jgi:hypothetical protein